MNVIKSVFLFMSVMLLTLSIAIDSSVSETITFNPDCKVCPVNLTFVDEEARNILGNKGLEQILRINNKKNGTIKIDLDGKRINGNETSPDDGYELIIIASPNIISISSLVDTSNMIIYTDASGMSDAADINTWFPKINIRPSDKIHRDDTAEVAWKKFENSKIYQWVGKNENIDAWKKACSKKILSVLEMLNAQPVGNQGAGS